MSLSFLKLFDLSGADAARYLIATPRPEMGSGVGTFSASPRRRYPASNSLDATAIKTDQKSASQLHWLTDLTAGCGLGYSFISF